MYKSHFEFENEQNRGFPFVSDMKHNLSYDVPHYHNELEIVYLTDGKLTAFADNVEYTVERGEFFIFMPGVVHSFDKSQINSIYYAKILPQRIQNSQDLSSLRPESCAIRHGDALHEALAGAVINLFEENERKTSGYEFAILRYANEILEKLLRYGKLAQIPRDEQTKVAAKLELMQAVNRFIDENYHEKIELADAARACGYSKFYFAHFFKEATQISFYSYLSTYRLERAISLIHTGNKTLTEIAHECGFGSVRSFNRTFRKYYSTSPSGFIKAQN